MASKRRLGSEDSEMRAAIIDAAAEVLQEEGFVSLTSRRVAERAGLKPQLVYYYFRTMNDLVVAVVRRGGDYAISRLARALASQNPIHAIWEQESDGRFAGLAVELLALSVHHENIKAEVVRFAEQARRLQAEAIAHHLELRGKKPPIPPLALTILVAAVGRLLMRERACGMSLGHREIDQVVQDWLGRLNQGGDAKSAELKTRTKPRKKAVRARSRRITGRIA